jgi:PIN domain nuclease of toxin-antitoxin system
VIVLDASAMLAFMFREAGHAVVEAALPSVCMSTVNLAEVLARFVRDGHSAATVWDHLSNTGIEWVPFTEAQSRIAADLVTTTASIGLSLADRACLALAIDRQLPTLTADRAWAQADVGVEVRMIRD